MISRERLKLLTQDLIIIKSHEKKQAGCSRLQSREEGRSYTQIYLYS